ncbi:MAG: N-acetyltransferase family protein [Syntrophobacteraceae bacterium]
MKIRACEPRDVAEITQIYAWHVLRGLATFELEPPDVGEMERRLHDVLNSGYPWLVAENEEKVTGYAYAGPYRSRPGYRYTVENSVYVHPDSLRQGIGRQLMCTLISECTKRGFRQMIAVIGDLENSASIGLHISLGFVVVGTLRSVGFKFERWVDSVLMQRELNE